MDEQLPKLTHACESLPGGMGPPRFVLFGVFAMLSFLYVIWRWVQRKCRVMCNFDLSGAELVRSLAHSALGPDFDGC